MTHGEEDECGTFCIAIDHNLRLWCVLTKLRPKAPHQRHSEDVAAVSKSGVTISAFENAGAKLNVCAEPVDAYPRIHIYRCILVPPTARRVDDARSDRSFDCVGEQLPQLKYASCRQSTGVYMRVVTIRSLSDASALQVLIYSSNLRNRWRFRHVPGPTPAWLGGNLRQVS